MAGEPQGTITVTGHGVVDVKPDIAFTTLFIRTDGILMSDAVRAADERSSSFTAILKERFSAIREIRSFDVRIGDRASGWRAEEKTDPPRPQVARCLLVVTPVDMTLQVGIVDLASRSGLLISNPAGERVMENSSVFFFGCSTERIAEQQSVASAIADARALADGIALPLGKSVGGVQTLSAEDPKNGYDDFRRGMVKQRFELRHISTDPSALRIKTTVTVGFAMN